MRVNENTARLVVDNAEITDPARLREINASRISESMGSSEVFVTLAVIDSSRHMSDMLLAFAEAGVAPEIEQSAVELAHAGLTLAVQARAKHVELHQRLLAIGRKLDVDPTSWGDCENYPKRFAAGRYREQRDVTNQG